MGAADFIIKALEIVVPALFVGGGVHAYHKKKAAKAGKITERYPGGVPMAGAAQGERKLPTDVGDDPFPGK
jgi:hypothetical protein